MHFVTHSFACPELPPISTTNPTTPSPPLALFIAYASHRTRLHHSVTFVALYLPLRLPAARCSSGHRLFISASTVICDDTYDAPIRTMPTLLLPRHSLALQAPQHYAFAIP